MDKYKSKYRVYSPNNPIWDYFLESHDPTVEPHGRAVQRLGLESIKRNMPIRLPKSISFVAGFKSAVKYPN